LLVENGIDTQHIRPVKNWQAGKKLLFMGSLAYYPNIDAACYFAEDVMPKIWEQDSEVVFCIAGKDPAETVSNLGEREERVEVIANPENMSQVAQECRMTVVPLRMGSGTRIKILHAMAMGLPVVSTSLGCEGLSIQDGQHLLIADNPYKLAEAVLQVVHDVELQQKLRVESRQLVEKFYDWTSIFSQYEAQLFFQNHQKDSTSAQTGK
jgi:glycosyltransferase involved in cell wall biosynthesis